jgi:hypothetical protein
MNQDAVRLQLLDCATSDWYTSPSDHRCPHDAWVEAVTISERVEGERQEKRAIEIQIRLLGAYHDGKIEYAYRGVNEYSLQTSGTAKGHGDWLRDNIEDCDGAILHSIALVNGKLQIKAADIEYKWTPIG